MYNACTYYIYSADTHKHTRIVILISASSISPYFNCKVNYAWSVSKRSTINSLETGLDIALVVLTHLSCHLSFCRVCNVCNEHFIDTHIPDSNANRCDQLTKTPCNKSALILKADSRIKYSNKWIGPIAGAALESQNSFLFAVLTFVHSLILLSSFPFFQLVIILAFLPFIMDVLSLSNVIIYFL